MISGSIIVPTAKLAIKRYTNNSSRSLAYSIIMIVIWGASTIIGLVVDIVLTTEGINL